MAQCGGCRASAQPSCLGRGRREPAAQLHKWSSAAACQASRHKQPRLGCADLLRRNQRSWPRQHGRRKQHSRLTIASVTQDALVPLGLDFLTFLAATVLVIPIFKSVKASPILGFLFSGLLLGQLG